MGKSYFDYTVPSVWVLREKYMVPYRFSQELRDYVEYMFTHPIHCKYRTLFAAQMKEWDTNDMLKYPYLIIKHYLDHPQQYGHSMENVVPHILAGMWKAFLNLHKQCRGLKLDKYLPMTMKLLVLGNGKFLDIFLSDIESGNLILHQDDMKKKLGRTQGMSKKHLDYLSSFE